MAEAILKVIATGAPYMICCAAVGLAYDSFMTWKRADSNFAARVEEASVKAALRLLGKIVMSKPHPWLRPVPRRAPERLARESQ
jgi:hypothetical protein